MTLTALLLYSALGAAPDWPQWRGPGRDGEIQPAARYTAADRSVQ